MVKGISDDEGDDLPVLWKKEKLEVSDATAAIAIKWQRTARARLQKVGMNGLIDWLLEHLTELHISLPNTDLTLTQPLLYFQRRGKGAGGREERDMDDEGADAKPFRSGKKSKTVRK